MKKKNLGYYLLILILGTVVGYFLSSMVNFLPPGAFKEALLRPLSFAAGPAKLDLRVINFTLGFGLNLNIVSVIGIFLVAWLFKVME